MTERRRSTDKALEAMQRFARRTQRILLVLFVVQMSLGVLAIYLLDQNNRHAAEIREAGVALCEKSNETRGAVRESYRADMERSKQIDPKLFPDIPPETYERLLKQANEGRAQTIRRLADVDCEAAFPKP